MFKLFLIALFLQLVTIISATASAVGKSRFCCLGQDSTPPSLTKYTITYGELKQRFESTNQELYFTPHNPLPDNTVMAKIGYHGTKYSVLGLISEQGLRASLSGRFGARIYTTPSLTSSIYYAMRANSRRPGDPERITDAICHLFMPVSEVLSIPYIVLDFAQPGFDEMSFTALNDTMVITVGPKRISQINYPDKYASSIYPLCQPLPPYKTESNKGWKTAQIMMRLYTGIPLFGYRMMYMFKRHSIVKDIKTFPYVKYLRSTQRNNNCAASCSDE